MTATADTSAEAYDGPTCWRCGGPCASYKGSVHGWTCTACLNRYLDEGAAKAEARDRRERQKLARKRIESSDNTDFSPVNGGRRGGGDLSYVPTTVSASRR
ncbi:hypothetical protein [Mycobacterium paraintracellulare]|uniref:hypothetical protein n=1 Tax=Mycobacterium paraintracellulare TaxID=1138383 RepID=UPI001F3653C7|nr:hypothetical protein [Mycobacterium paraintracellulare]